MHARTSVLHPDVGHRGLLGQPKTVWVPWLAVLVVGGLLYMAVPSPASLVTLIVVLFVFVGVTWQHEDVPSAASIGVEHTREWLRRRRGEHAFWPVQDEDDYLDGFPGHGFDPTFRHWEFPPPLGSVKPLQTGDDLFALQHSNPGETEYLSVLLNVQGLPGGLRSPDAYAPAQLAFGRVLAQLAKKGSHVRGLQQIHRSVPYDTRQHVMWYTGGLTSGDTIGPVVLSYDQLVGLVKLEAEDHRAFVVARIPITSRFLSAAKDRGVYPHSWAAVVRDELDRVSGMLRSAGLGQVTVLGESRTCAVLRALQDPSFPIDKHAGVTWENCWQHYIGHRDHVAVNGEWFTAVATIGGVEPAELGPLWLSPLLTRMEKDNAADVENAATVRTISVRTDLVPQARARARAKVDRSSDVAAQITEHKKGVVTDGTSAAMRAASETRAQDLVPGSGHHGVLYTIVLSVTARDLDALRRAVSRAEDAAAECAIPCLKWFTNWHDVAVFGTYPLGRGMAETKDAVRVGR